MAPPESYATHSKLASVCLETGCLSISWHADGETQGAQNLTLFSDSMDPIGSASPESKPVLSSVTATPPAPAMRSGCPATRACGLLWVVLSPPKTRGSASEGEKPAAGDTATARATHRMVRGIAAVSRSPHPARVYISTFCDVLFLSQRTLRKGRVYNISDPTWSSLESRSSSEHSL